MIVPFENQMHSRLKRWALIGLAAFSIVIVSEVGRLTGLPTEGLKISNIWPSAGFALAAILLFGYRISWGIFLGILFYNTSHLLGDGSHIPASIAIATLISIGSTLQALAAAFIIRRFSTPTLFNNLRDVFVFLIPGVLIAHTIACSISVPLMAFGGYIDWNQALFLWLIFWIGDFTGALVFAPFIYIWSTADSWKMDKDKRPAALLIAVIYSVFAYVIFILAYPLTYLIVALLLWITFLFGMPGATLTTLVTALLTVISVSLGYGVYIIFHLENASTVMVSYIDFIGATALILAAALAEREDAWGQLINYKNNLEDTIYQRTMQLNKLHETFKVKKKLVSLGMLAAGIGREIKTPLAKIQYYTQGGKDCLDVLQGYVNDKKNLLDPSKSPKIETTLNSLWDCLYKIGDYDSQALKTVDIIIRTVDRLRFQSSTIEAIDLHQLINKSLVQARHDLSLQNLDFPFEIIKEYSNSACMVDGIYDDLFRAFVQVFDNSFYALREKKSQSGNSFHPLLIVRTREQNAIIEIDIYDNGTGMPQEVLNKAFAPFFTTKPAGEGAGLGLAIIHDIFVQEHHGKIIIDAQEGIFTEMKISLPKSKTNGG